MTPSFAILSSQLWFQDTQNAPTEGTVSPSVCGV